MHTLRIGSLTTLLVSVVLTCLYLSQPVPAARAAIQHETYLPLALIGGRETQPGSEVAPQPDNAPADPAPLAIQNARALIAAANAARTTLTAPEATVDPALMGSAQRWADTLAMSGTLRAAPLGWYQPNVQGQRVVQVLGEGNSAESVVSAWSNTDPWRALLYVSYCPTDGCSYRIGAGQAGSMWVLVIVQTTPGGAVIPPPR